MSSRKWAAVPVLALSLLLALGGVALAATPSSPTSAGGVVPYIVDDPDGGGNVTCAALGYEFSSDRVNYNNGSFDAAFPAGISVNVTGGTYVSWTSTFGIGAVIVKGSNDANVYEYSPAALGDSGLASPLTPSGSPAGLSNLTFCWDEQEEEELCPDLVLLASIPLGILGDVRLAELEEICGRIIVEKVAANAPPGSEFEFDSSWGDNFFLGHGESEDSGPLPPGIYSVAEIVPAGFVLGGAVCDDGSDPSAIGLEAGETVTCTFTNRMVEEPEDGRIIVQKVAANAPAGYQFEFDPSWGANFFLGHLGSHDSGLLEPGVYSVSEIVPTGFVLAGAVCDDGSSPAAIGLEAGETVTCTFTNRMIPEEEEQAGRIIVVKETVPAGSDVEFDFAASWQLSFFLSDGESHDSGLLEPGVYSVSEVNLPVGWSMTSAVCDDGSSPAAIGLEADETVTCTFTNSQQQVLGPEGSLTIIKLTNPAGGEGFGFDAGSLGDFTLADGGSVLFSELEPGAYTVTEDDPAGDWQFQSVVCEALDWSAAGQSVTVNLAEGEAAVCTFYNIAELPFTGPASWHMPLLVIGLGALLLGTGMLAVPAVRRMGRK